MQETSSAPTRLKTDISAARLIERFERDATLASIGDVLPRDVELAPSMSMDGDGRVYLEFTIGVKRMYIVRDVYALGRAVANRGIIDYGKGLSVLHEPERFCESSRALALFISRLTERTGEAAEYLCSGNGLPAPELRRLYIPSHDFAGLAAILNGRTIPFSGITETSVSATFYPIPPDFGFTIKEKDGGASISHKLGAFRMIKNDDAELLYVFTSVCDEDDDGHIGIYDCSGKNAQTLSLLLGAFLANHKADALDFSRETLYKLSQFAIARIRSAARLSGRCPGRRTAVDETNMIGRIYLDKQRGKQDAITASVKFVYGGNIEIDAYAHEMPLTAARVPRDTVGELKLLLLMKKYGFNSAGATSCDGSGMLSIAGDDRVYLLLHDGLAEMRAAAEIYVTDAVTRIEISRPEPPIVHIKLRGGLLSMQLNCSIPSDELVGVLAAYREKKSYHRLKNGNFLSLDDENIGLLSDLSENLELDERELNARELSLPSYRSIYINTLLKKHPASELRADKSYQSMINSFAKPPDVDSVSSSLDGTLREYQKTGLRWLCGLASYGLGGILADEMGLGKTVQVIALLTCAGGSPIRRGKAKPSLIVAPTSLVYNWKSELARFAPELPVTVVSSTAVKRKECIESIADGVVITSYDALKRDIEYYRGKAFRYAIIDEAQYIKNQATQAAAAVKEIVAESRFALTGTPIENSLADLWSIFDFILPGYFHTYSHFRRKIEIPITRDGDAEIAKRLSEQVKPFILRRTKKDVLRELPDKIESVIYAEMADEQRRIYDANMALAREEINDELSKNGFDQSRMKILSLITRLRQLCCHPALYIENYTDRSAKLELCMELLSDGVAAGHRVLVFSQFTSMLAIIKSELSALNVTTFTLKGDTPAEERQMMVDRFNAGEAEVFLISLKAGGTGLNLTSADMVIHYDPWWNLSAQNQATGRAHRMGQTHNVQVFKLLAKDSIEEKIQELQFQKDQIAKSVITETEAFVSSMNRDDLMSLFSEC